MWADKTKSYVLFYNSVCSFQSSVITLPCSVAAQTAMPKGSIMAHQLLASTEIKTAVQMKTGQVNHQNDPVNHSQHLETGAVGVAASPWSMIRAVCIRIVPPVPHHLLVSQTVL